MNDILIIVSVVLGLGLIFFILNGAYKTRNLKKRGLLNLIVGLSLSLIFFIALYLDLKFDLIILKPYYYFLFIGIFAFYGILLFLIMFIKGEKAGYGLSRGKIRYAARDINYLYVVIKYKDSIYLHEKDSSGFVTRFRNRDYIEVVMANLLKQNGGLKLIPENVTRIGLATIKKRKLHIYQCYLVEADTDVVIKGCKKVDQFEIVKENMKYFDKQIILRILMKEHFNVVLETK